MNLIWKLVILVAFLSLTETMTCFLESLMVVMLILDLTSLSLLIMLFILIIFLSGVFRNIFLMWIMSLILIFEACVYDFLLLMGKVNLLLFNFARSRGGFDLGTLRTTKEFLIKYFVIFIHAETILVRLIDHID